MSDMIINAKSAVMSRCFSVRERIRRNFVENRGDGWTDLLIKIGIAVLIGGLVITFIRLLVPKLFTEIEEWIFSLFDFDSTSTPATTGEGG